MNNDEERALRATIERQQVLLDKAASILSDAALSEDFDADDGLDLVKAIQGQFEDVGKTTAVHELETLCTKVGEVCGIPAGDEFFPLKELDKIAAAHKARVDSLSREYQELGKQFMEAETLLNDLAGFAFAPPNITTDEDALRKNMLKIVRDAEALQTRYTAYLAHKDVNG